MTGNPQKENGYTPIANELMDVLCTVNFTAYEWRVLMFILRKTYGWRKSSDVIALSQFEDGVGIPRKHICRTINLLVRRKVIDKTKLSKSQTAYYFNKKYHSWIIPSLGNVASPSLGNKGVPHQGHTKETIQKKITKEKEFKNWKQTFKTIKSM